MLRAGECHRERAAVQQRIDAFESQLVELVLLRQGPDAYAARAELAAADRQAALHDAAATLSLADALPGGPNSSAAVLFQASRELGRARVRGRLRTPATSMDGVVAPSRRH